MRSRLVLMACATIIALSFLGISSRASASERIGVRIAAASLPALNQMTEQNPGIFGGMYRAGGIVYVDYTHAQVHAASGELSRFLARSGSQPGLRLVKRMVPYSLSQLNAVMRRVWTAEPWAREARPLITYWYPDPATDKVLVGVTRITPAVQRAAHAVFGQKVRLFRGQRIVPAEKFTRVNLRTLRFRHITARAKGSARADSSLSSTPSRLTDSVPYFGGDRIVRVFKYNGVGYVGQCTAAFKWTLSSSYYMSTAGHCSYPSGGVGTQWLQGYYDQSTNTINYTGTMGYIAKNIWGQKLGDAALMNRQSYGRYVYTSNTATQPVVAYSGVYKGETGICADGSFTGQNCTGGVAAVNISEPLYEGITGQTFTVEHLDEVVSSNSSRLVQAGDSGGPCYKNESTGVKAVGIISGGNSSGEELFMSDMSWMTSTSGLPGHPTT